MAEEVQRIIAEQGLSQTGLIEESKIIETGKILGVDAIMLGTAIYKRVHWYYQGQYITKDGIGNASIRLVNTETGALIGGIKFKNGQGVLTFKEMDAIALQISTEILNALGKNNSIKNYSSYEQDDFSTEPTHSHISSNNSSSLNDINDMFFFDIKKFKVTMH